MPQWADAINSFIRQDYKPYYGKESTLGTFSTVGSGRSGRLKPGDPDDFLKLLEQRANRSSPSMPARGSKRGRVAPSRRSTKRKAPRGRKTIKRKAPIRKSTKRKKRKVSSKAQSVSVTVGTARSRIVDHASVGYTHAAYEAFSSIGSRVELMKPIAQALLLHYMHRVGDYRLNSTVVPERYFEAATVANPQIATWSQMKFMFLSPTIASDANTNEITLDAQSGDLSVSLDAMTNSLAAAIFLQVKLGRRLSQVTVFRSNNCIVCDTNAGRNVVEFSCSAVLKLQNVTLADSVATGNDSGDRCSATNIHRNPLNGLTYSFRNAQPILKQGYKLSKVQAEQDVILPLEAAYSSRYAGIDATPTLGSAAGTEWRVPPVRPSTMFTNVGAKSSVSIQPGSHKTYSMKEYYSGPINSMFNRYFPVLSTLVTYPVPTPGGSSMMVCLKPQYRTSTSENIQLETEHSYTYAARVTRGKMSVMPMQVHLA